MVSRLLTFFTEETAERAADAVIMNDVDDDYHQKIASFFLGYIALKTIGKYTVVIIMIPL